MCAFGLGFLAVPNPDVEVRQLPAMIVEREPPRFSDVPEEPVPVGPADDLARLAGDYPDGTTFELAAGVYRQDRIIPRHGQTFRGQDGVVFNGSVVLDPEEFDVDDEGRWFIDGQEQEGFAVGQTTEGNEVDLHPEEVFVDGNRRLDHVGSIGDLEPGAWHFDYAADRIYLADEPAGFDLIETSVGAFAFGGAAVRDVVISDIVVEKYASPHYFGALGGSEGEAQTFDWLYRRVVARYNHGGGIVVGPGTTIESSRVHHNGQIGIVGEGQSSFNDYTARVTVRDTEIDHNLQLGFRWQHEGGGTKFKRMSAGMLFERNWVHDNNGPGAWWDVYNDAVVIRDNLVEDNTEMGIYYEISDGPTRIEDNISINNGRGGIEISTSNDVTVSRNLVWGNGDGIVAQYDQNQIGDIFPDGLVNVEFIDNQVWMSGLGFSGVEVFGGPDEVYGRVTFSGNRYSVSGEAEFRVDGDRLDAREWLERNPEDGPTDRSGSVPEQRADRMRSRMVDGDA